MKMRGFLPGLIVILFIVLPILFSIYGDFLWFGSLDYQSVFLTILGTSVMLGVVFFTVFVAFSFINIHIARKISSKKSKPDFERILFLVSVIIGLVLAVSYSDWGTYLRFVSSTPFGVTDPVFGMDVAFYSFTLPFYGMILRFMLSMFAITAAITAITHIIYSRSLKTNVVTNVLENDEEAMSRNVTVDWSGMRKHLVPHLSVLLFMIFLMLGVATYLSVFGLVFSESGAVYGAGYTDVNITLPFINIMSFVLCIVAVFFLLNIKFRKYKIIRDGIIAVVVIGIVGIAIAGIVQGFVVEPDEYNMEESYITRNIENTLAAYGLDSVQEREFELTNNLTAQSISNNNGTIGNIRLWDWRPLRETYNQLQLFRTYYEFSDIDIDRYNLGGEYKEVMISPREINTNLLDENARTWVNQHLVYTHGYGVVMNPVDKVTEQGHPIFYMKNIPPSSDYVELQRPEIYYGEKTDMYIITDTETEEFDYPSGEQNTYTSYEGEGGVGLEDFLSRFVYAVKFGSIEILFSGSIKPESKILMHRTVSQRIKKIAPFLEYDFDPYIVMSEGRLYWIIDGYSITDKYPYSEPLYSNFWREKFNYLRNSVKVVVDAYNGDVTYYVIEKDPVIQTYMGMFPGLFKDFSEMPEGLKSHIRYPETMFTAQSTIYSTYHMKESRVFYNKEDVWTTPQEIYRGSRQDMTPYFVIMKLPGEEKEEFILMIPFTPSGRENMIAWMAARCDTPNYGDLTVYKFSKQELIYGPMQIEARIDQDTDISQLITLWGQGGSSVLRGNTLVIPIDNSVLYIEPLYLEATEKGTLPELKRVIVAYGNRISMKETLEEALEDVFGAAPDDGTEPGEPSLPPGTPEETLEAIKELYSNAQAALKTGDLALYAEYMDQIGDLLE